MEPGTNNLLHDCRVLDLTDEKGFLCGKILGDLGADVIKIEPPQGDRSRNVGPFYHDIPHPEKSLYWFAYNGNKRGITLNIETADGREIFKKLVKKADIVVNSFQAGYMDKIGLGHDSLAGVNPQVVTVSITPFGETGPYKDYKAPDIVTAAMSGGVYVTGDADRAPLRIGFPQSYLYAGASAAVGALIAYHHSRQSGEGQHVDVSTQEAMVPFSATQAPFWYMLKTNLMRRGVFREGTAAKAVIRMLWPCKDGYVSFTVMGTPTGAKTNKKFMELMEKEGLAGALQNFDWDGFDRRTATQETQTRVEEAIAPFIARHTKEELFGMAVDNGIMLLPVYTPAELLECEQLKTREYWKEIEHPELGVKVTYPGSFVRCSETDCSIKRRAPLIGEHNEEIYANELGFSKKKLVMMKEAGII